MKSSQHGGQQRPEKRPSNEPEDILTLLLAALDSDTLAAEVRLKILAVIAAGHETAASAGPSRDVAASKRPFP
jgi:cytochrome P450